METGRSAATAVLAFLLAGTPAARAQEDDPPATVTQEQYVEIMNKVLDGFQDQVRSQTLHPLRFSANLWYAHEACIEGSPLDVLTATVDALKDAGVARVDINMGPFPWLEPRNEAVIAKYDALVKHIREVGLGLALNPCYTKKAHEIRGIEEWQAAALKFFPEIARRYQPELFVVVHEPTTQAGRMGARIEPEAWAEFARTLARSVKEVSPKSRCGAGVLAYEAKYFERFLELPELDTLSFDIYSVRGLRLLNVLALQAQKRGKAMYIEETGRPPYYVPVKGHPEVLDAVSAKGVGCADFAALDARWLETMALYGAAWGMETVTPFWTPTFFHYDKEGGNAFDPGYNLRVFEAIRAGERTSTYDAFRRIVRERREGR